MTTADECDGDCDSCPGKWDCPDSGYYDPSELPEEEEEVI